MVLYLGTSLCWFQEVVYSEHLGDPIILVSSIVVIEVTSWYPLIIFQRGLHKKVRLFQLVHPSLKPISIEVVEELDETEP